MICAYPADCSDFSTNGNGALSPLSATVTETLNGEYELQLVHPIDEAGKCQRLVEGCILRAPVPAAMTPRVNFSAPGDDSGAEIWRVNTDFSGAETLFRRALQDCDFQNKNKKALSIPLPGNRCRCFSEVFSESVKSGRSWKEYSDEKMYLCHAGSGAAAFREQRSGRTERL